jgi:hypothetical protein
VEGRTWKKNDGHSQKQTRVYTYGTYEEVLQGKRARERRIVKKSGNFRDDPHFPLSMRSGGE